jgi:Flp pilus assembly protein TadG
MNQSMIRKQNGLRSESGVTIVVVTFFMVALFAFAALSLDVGNVLREQRKAQIATDAAALAGVVRLTNSVQDVSLAITTATAIAVANGVTSTEISDSPLGAVEVGVWSNGTFRSPIGSERYNAVRVPARRTVPLNFGRVVGLGTMSPVVKSVAALQSLTQPTGLRPWGVSSNLVASLATNTSVIVDVKQDNSGVWGEVDFNQKVEDWSTTDWKNYMLNGYDGSVDLNDPYAAEIKKGNPQLSKTLQDWAASGEVVFIPVVAGWFPVLDDEKKFLPLVGFIAIQITQGPDPGNKNQVVFTLVDALGTGSGTGTSGSIWLKGRNLVQ